jgi:DNA repair exonuclease SbcCD ATPase subunit
MAQTQTNNNTSAEIGKRLFNGEQAKDIAAELGIDTSSFSRSQPQYFKAYIAALQTELNKSQTTATQLQGVNNGLQKSCEKLQTAVTELQANASTTAVTSEQMQAMETNLQLTTERLRTSETNLQTVTSQLQTKASELQVVTIERNGIAEQLQAATDQLQILATDRNQLANELQAVAKVRKPIAEQRILTHARFLLWAIIGFETYNAWQLLSNMELQQFPYPMAVVFSMFFGLASVTALAANHRWGVILCVTAAFFSNAIHADLFGSLTLSGLFYTLLPCLLILLFADMYRKTNVL